MAYINSTSSYTIIKLIPAYKSKVFLIQNIFLFYLLLTLDNIK
jgi:hypothetical protein